jgi:hypothetical protein
VHQLAANFHRASDASLGHAIKPQLPHLTVHGVEPGSPFVQLKFEFLGCVLALRVAVPAARWSRRRVRRTPSGLLVQQGLDILRTIEPSSETQERSMIVVKTAPQTRE